MPRRPGRPRSQAAAASASSRHSTRASFRCGSRGRCAASTRRRSCRPRRHGAWTATSCMAVAAAHEAWDDAGVEGVRPCPGRDPRRLRDRRDRDDRRAAAGLPRAGSRPRLAVLHPLGARRHGERSDRDPAGTHRAELRAGLGVRNGLDGDRRGSRDDRARAGRHHPRGWHRGRDHPAHPRRLLRHAGARGRGGRPDPRDASLRRDAGRLRDGRGSMHPRARGVRGGEGARRDDLRRGARLRRLERRSPSGTAGARGDRGSGDDRGGARSRRASRPSASATSTRTGRRRRSATSPRLARSARSSASTPTSSPSRRRSR